MVIKKEDDERSVSLGEESANGSMDGSENEDGNGYEADSFVVED